MSADNAMLYSEILYSAKERLSLDVLIIVLTGLTIISVSTLESGIDVAPWINVASGKFDKKK